MRVMLIRLAMWILQYMLARETESVPQSFTGQGLTGKPSEARSSHWPIVRAAHLRLNPKCAATGDTNDLEVHHVEPYHLRPDLELDPSNLITLTEKSKTLAGLNMHFIAGHLCNWSDVNPSVRRVAAFIRKSVGNE